jgi:hypothetical protein
MIGFRRQNFLPFTNLVHIFMAKLLKKIINMLRKYGRHLDVKI